MNFLSVVLFFEEKSHRIYPSFDKLISDERFEVEEKLNETVASNSKQLVEWTGEYVKIDMYPRKKPTKLERRKITAGV